MQKNQGSLQENRGSMQKNPAPKREHGSGRAREIEGTGDPFRTRRTRVVAEDRGDRSADYRCGVSGSEQPQRRRVRVDDPMLGNDEDRVRSAVYQRSPAAFPKLTGERVHGHRRQPCRIRAWSNPAP